MSNRRMIIIAGWAHTASDLSPVCSLLSGKYDIQATSTAKLLKKVQKTNHASSPSLSSYAQALYELISRTSEPPVVIAWSMGALVAMETIIRLSPAISRLVIVSGTARFCSCEDYPNGIPEQTIRAMAVNLDKKPEEVLSAFFRETIFPGKDTDPEMEEKTQRALSLSTKVLRDGLSYLCHTDLRSELSEIRVPTLIIHGRQDRIVPLSAGEFLKNHINGSNLTIHNHEGHTLILDQPALIAEDIRTFVEA